MAVTTASYGWIDHSAEGSRTQLNFPALSAANFDDITGAAPGGAINDMRVALELVTKLNETRVSASLDVHSAVGSIPADATAQREIAARMIYVDNVTTQRYRFDIPAPADDFVPTGSDDINMAAAVWVAFKAAFEANCVSPVGNPVTLISGRIVGRRS